MEWAEALDKWSEAQALGEAADGGGFYVSATPRAGKLSAALCLAPRPRPGQRDRPKERMFQVYRCGTCH